MAQSIKLGNDTFLDASGVVMSDHTTLDASHANYSKHPDGTLIQWGVINTSTPKSLTGTQTGTLYYHEYLVNEAFPIPFIASPFLILSKSGGRVASIGWASFDYNKIVEIDVLSGLQTLSGESPGVIINWLAVGRWK